MMKNRFFRIIVCLFTVFLCGCSGLMFHPYRAHVRTPEMVDLQYEDVFLETQDQVKIHGWFLPAQAKLKGSVYFLHGNAENISTHIASVYWLPEQGYQVFLLDYRGYGLSEGEPDLPEVFLDIEASFSWLLKRAEQKPMFILGQSLGASLATYFVAHNESVRENLAGLVSDAAFTNYFEIARHVSSKLWITWPLQYPIGWAMDYPFHPIEAINKISPIPVLIVHSKDDHIIPFEHGEQLYETAKQPKSFLATQGMHGYTFSFIKNRHLLLGFFRRSGS